jgi:medium-chain acyl-[acyl-carrier-protein] hydrolase
VFAGLDDAEVSGGETEAWQEQTIAPFSLRFFPGDHFFIHTSQEALVQELSQKLLVAR